MRKTALFNMVSLAVLLCACGQDPLDKKPEKSVSGDFTPAQTLSMKIMQKTLNCYEDSVGTRREVLDNLSEPTGGREKKPWIDQAQWDHWNQKIETSLARRYIYFNTKPSFEPSGSTFRIQKSFERHANQKNVLFYVSGHADLKVSKKSPANANLRESLLRAWAIADLILAAGIERGRICIVARGAEDYSAYSDNKVVKITTFSLD